MGISHGGKREPLRYIELLSLNLEGADILQAMFNILEADIVVMQETKIQRRDLRDDMVLVPGWDVYFSLPRHKKGTKSHNLRYWRRELTVGLRRLFGCCYLHA